MLKELLEKVQGNKIIINLNNALDLEEDKHLDENTCNEIKKFIDYLFDAIVDFKIYKNPKRKYVLGINNYEIDDVGYPCYLELNINDIDIFNDEGKDYPASKEFTAKDIEKFLLEVFKITRDIAFYLDKEDKYVCNDREFRYKLNELPKKETEIKV
jgi:hypothetical protein